MNTPVIERSVLTIAGSDSGASSAAHDSSEGSRFLPGTVLADRYRL